MNYRKPSFKNPSTLKQKLRKYNGNNIDDMYDIRCTHPVTKMGICDICGKDLIGE